MQGADCRDWLRAYLGALDEAGVEMIEVQEVVEDGGQAGASYRSLFNAKKALGVQTLRQGIGKEHRAFWSTKIGDDNE